MQDYDSVESLSSSPVESEDPQFRVLSPEPPRPCPVQPLVLDVPSRVDSPPLSPQFDSLREDPRINCVAPQPLRPPFVFEDEFQPHLNELDALLADLQNTVTAPGSNHGPRERNLRSNDYATVNSHADQNNKKVQRSSSFNNAQPQSPTYSNEIVFNKKNSSNINNSPSSNNKMTTSLNNNLSELDTLLQDLSNSKYATTDRKVTIDSPKLNGYSHNHSDFDLSASQRPSVDSLLEQLNTTTTPNGDGQYVTKLLMEETTTTTTRTVRPTASSATKELDDLMASLSEFKVSKPKQAIESTATYQSESIYAKPNRNKEFTQTTEQLDCMLGTLQVEMSKQGVNTTQKGCCSACDKPIVGQVITALGKTWHPEHFTCTHCQQELGTRNFFERDGRPYCEPDYHNLFSPRCAYCNGPILDKCVTALEKTWHTEHFFCAQCGKQFGEEGFHERDGKPYCRDDYFNLFAPKCGACSRPIMENYVSALSSQWHADCFVCRDCKEPVRGKSFYAMEGKPVCPKCVGVDEEE
nr:PREDICTED: leupaxin-like isoform X2 [Bemisia tabaci]